MDTKHFSSERKRRIDEIIGLQREPAIEAWRKVEAGGDETSSAKELGFQIEYFQTLLAQEFVARLNEGKSFFEFPKLSTTLECLCWRRVCKALVFDRPETIETQLCKQLRLKLLNLFRSGVSSKELAQFFDLNEKKANALIMLALAEDDLTLNEIGNVFCITREGVRKTINNLGVSVKSIRLKKSKTNERNQDSLRESIESWVNSHPGCYLSEVISVFNVREADVLILCPQILRKLTIGLRPNQASEKLKRYPREQILAALQAAYEFRNPLMSMYSATETRPLTGPYYEDLVKKGKIFGPTQSRLLQIFDTWKSACKEAGVPSVDAVRDSYELRWTDEELINQLAEFISTSESVSVESFDSWCRLDNSRASSGTLRNQIGGWSESYELGLMQLRQKWISA